MSELIPALTILSILHLQELLAKYLDSYLHYLSLLPGLDDAVNVLRKFKSRIFHLLVNLRRPTDSLGKRSRHFLIFYCCTLKEANDMNFGKDIRCHESSFLFS